MRPVCSRCKYGVGWTAYIKWVSKKLRDKPLLCEGCRIRG